MLASITPNKASGELFRFKKPETQLQLAIDLDYLLSDDAAMEDSGEGTSLKSVAGK